MLRLVLVTLLALHGLAHLVGFLSPWGLTPAPGAAGPSPTNAIFGGRVVLGHTAGRILGLLWLAAAAALLIVAFGVLRRATWAWPAFLVVVTASLVLCLVWWPVARIGLWIDLALLVGLLLVGYVAFRRDIRSARERIAGRSEMIETRRGNIELAMRGEGQPALVLHGTGGGWDQGLFAAGALTKFGFRIIAPSRFGYLRTPLPAVATAAEEADTWAALLDTLGIERIPVIAFSAGAAPALQLAIRHPDRVSALVLVVPGPGGISETKVNAPPAYVVNLVLKNEFPMWAMMQLAPNVLYRLAAVPPALVRTLEREDYDRLWEGIRLMLPVSARYAGMMYDSGNQGSTELYPIERIVAPTLLVSAEDDLYGTLDVARNAARKIRGARVVAFETGGHFLLGRESESWPQIAEFLEANSVIVADLAASLR